MFSRISIVCLALLQVVPQANAKNKKQQILPDYVLNAQRVVVVLHPDAGEPLSNPTANRTAQECVETAITKWGRFNVVMDSQTADLVVVVRKGHANGPTINNSPSDNRPVIYQPNDRGIRIGGQHGRPSDVRDPSIGGSPGSGPRIGNEIGSSEDSFEVYRGGVEYPLDAAPLWRYSAKDALNEPRVAAVEQFRKAIEESEKQRQQKP